MSSFTEAPAAASSSSSMLSGKSGEMKQKSGEFKQGGCVGGSCAGGSHEVGCSNYVSSASSSSMSSMSSASMSSQGAQATHDAFHAAVSKLPAGDVLNILLQQHERIKSLFTQIKGFTLHPAPSVPSAPSASASAAAASCHTGCSGGNCSLKSVFDELRVLLAIHEAGEELVIRPVTLGLVGKAITDERNKEESDAAKELYALENMDINSPDFATNFAKFETAVLRHSENEETFEFPALLNKMTLEHRIRLGEQLLRAQKSAPTHPHPSTDGNPTLVKFAGPFASMMDRVRDAFKGSGASAAERSSGERSSALSAGEALARSSTAGAAAAMHNELTSHVSKK